jgi:class 3 adenylate cyclase
MRSAAAFERAVTLAAASTDVLEGSGPKFEDAGSHDLKGLSGARSLYQVEAPATSTV